MSEDPNVSGEAVADEMVLPAQTTPLVASVISDESWTVATSNWINAHVRGSPIAQSTEAWNHLGAVLPHLRDFLETELGRKSI